MSDKDKSTDTEEDSNYKRRSILGTGATAGAVAILPGLVSGKNSSRGNNLNGNGSSDFKPGEVTKIIDKQKFTLYRFNKNDRVSLGKFYTSGSNEGQLEYMNVSGGNSNDKFDVDKNGGLVQDQATIENTFNSNSSTVIKRSKNIDRQLVNCEENFCTGFTYTHSQTGFTVEFVDQISNIEATILEEAITILIESYAVAKKSWVLGLVGIIVGTLASIATGVSATVSPWDHDKSGPIRGSRPAVEMGVAEAWDVDAENLTNIKDNENTHIGALDSRCG